MSDEALNAHLERISGPPEEMVEVEKGYLEYLEEGNAELKRENEKEHEQVCQFIRDMYTGRFAEREEYYWELPQWIRDAIEEDPIYSTAEHHDE